MHPALDGVLFFPVTPFTESGDVDTDRLGAARRQGRRRRPRRGLHRLWHWRIPRAGRVRVRAPSCAPPSTWSAAGSRCTRVRAVRSHRPRRSPTAAAEAGADGLLLLPPYLVEMPQAGLVAYTRAVTDATDLPVIVYNRNNARYTEDVRRAGRTAPQGRRIQGRHRRSRSGGPHRACGDRRARAHRQAVPVLQRPADRRGVTTGLPRDRRDAVLVGDLRVRARTWRWRSTKHSKPATNH